MSNTQNSVSPAQAAIVGKIAPANMKPKRLLGRPEGEQEMFLGTLVGICDKFVTRKAPDETVYIGYGGSFEFVDSDSANGSLKSGVLFMPGGIDEAMKAACEAAFEESGAQVRLAFEVSAFRSTAPAGYSWKFTPLVKPAQVDPLDELKALVADRGRNLLSSNKVKALENQTIEGEAAPAGKNKEKAPA